MPIVQIELLEGKTLEQKRQMARKVTQAIVESLECPAETVRIIFRDMRKEDFAVAGKLRIDE